VICLRLLGSESRQLLVPSERPLLARNEWNIQGFCFDLDRRVGTSTFASAIFVCVTFADHSRPATRYAAQATSSYRK
jgi:hypothetical protein